METENQNCDGKTSNLLNIIDCDCDPLIPKGWKIEKHNKNGLISFDLKNISLYLSEEQKNRAIVGHILRDELSGKSAVNANVLDYLLAHTEIIPEEWKNLCICFWGTIYRDGNNEPYVLCLAWSDSRWCWRNRLLDRCFGANSPAAVMN